MEKTAVRILILEDEPSDAVLNEREIKKVFNHCSVKVVQTREEFILSLEEFVPDIIVSDYSLPGFDGMSALKLSLEKTPETPVIIVTGSINENTAVECLKTGATDYILKEYIARLPFALKEALEQKRIRSEKEKAEESLRLSEERFRSLYENSTIGLYRTTPDGRIILANPALVNMLGYSSFEELSGKNLGKEGFEPSYERKYFLEQIELQGEIKGLESAWSHQNNSVVYVRESARAIRDSNGNTLYYDGTVEDITERKRTEEALRENEFKLRLILESINEIIYSTEQISPDSYQAFVTFVSARSETIIGIKPDEFIKNADLWFSLVHPEDKSLVNDQTSEIFSSKQPGLRVYRILNKQKDNYIWIEDLVVPKLDEQGRVIATFGVARDITDRKKAEEELIQKNTFIQTVLDNLPIGVALNKIDKGNAFYINKKFEETYGWPQDEMKDIACFFEKVYPDKKYREELMTKIMADLQSGDISRMHWEDCIVTHKDGSQHFVNAVNIPLFEQNTMVSTAIDMTERKKAEEALEKKADQLERFNNLMIGRENKMSSLKKEINELLKKLGEKEKY